MKKVGIVMGSRSDLPTVEKAADVLRAYGVEFEVRVLSAHRCPDEAREFAASAREKGADLCGVASAATIDALAERLREIRRDEVLVSATDNNPRMMPYDPSTKLEKRNIRGASQFLDSAKSVIVLGMH